MKVLVECPNCHKPVAIRMRDRTPLNGRAFITTQGALCVKCSCNQEIDLGVTVCRPKTSQDPLTANAST